MSDRLLVANGDGVFTVSQNGNGFTTTFVEAVIGAECIAVAPHDPSLIFVGAFGGGLWRSTDGGASFTRLDFPAQSVLSLAVSLADGAIYAGCEPSMLFRSRDDGETWVELEALRQLPTADTWSFPLRPWTHHVRQVAPSPHDPKLIIAGIELGGVMRSEDDGVTWKDHRPGAVKDCHGLTWHPTEPGRVYEAGGGGSAWSHDGGDTWTRVDEGREAAYRHYLTAVAVDPTDPDCWYVGASPTPWQVDDAAMYRWRGEGPWEKLEGGLPDALDGYPFAFSINEEALFVALKDGRIWRGRDRGERWDELELHGAPLAGLRDIQVLS